MPQGPITKDTLLLKPPLAPRRSPPRPHGADGFDRVAALAALARGWFKLQALSHTGGDVIEMTAMALKVQREIDDAEKRAAWESEHRIEPSNGGRPKTGMDDPPSSPLKPAAPGVRRRQIEPKGERQ